MRSCWLIPIAGLAACAVPEPRGELVGDYAIAGELTDNSCGSEALPARSPLKFNVQLRIDKGEGLWIRDMPPPQSGRLDDDGAFSFRTQSIYDVPAAGKGMLESSIKTDPAAAADPTAYDNFDLKTPPPCRLTITETIGGKLTRDQRAQADAGAGDTSSASDKGEADLTADNKIEISAAAGSNCGRVMAAAGGPFLALPCSAQYQLRGDLVEE